MPSLDSLTDTELINLLKSGNSVAYTIIYNRYFNILYLHAYRKLLVKEEAQDVIHELFSNIWNKRTELDIKSNLSYYLYTAVRNKILDNISHQKVKTRYANSLQLFMNNSYCVTDHLIREKQLKELIEKGIDSLPQKMKAIFELSRKEELSNREIAAQLNLSEQTVKKQIHNALKVLRAKLSTMLFFI